MQLTNKSLPLSPQQLERTQNALRLCETKIRDVETSLQRLRIQQQWLHRWQEKSHELTEHQNRLYQVNKQLASMTNDEKELLRFEQFETVQGLFQRMTLLEQLSRENKQTQSIVARELEEKQHRAEDNQKRLSQLADDRRDAANQMLTARDQLQEANRILGAQTILKLDERETGLTIESINKRQTMLLQDIKETEEQLRTLQEDITRLNIEHQSMEPHQNLMEHGEKAITLLDRLQELKSQTTDQTHNLKEIARRQQEENDMLNRVFTEFQSVETDIKALNAELQLHRQQNLGRSSYSLQERAMQLKSRRQMLISAQSLWNRIQAGYIYIEEKTQSVNRLRLNIENLRQNIETLETKVVPMRQLCHDKEYTLTLSKSQNVIQLRGDLKEGMSCTVCGATHHPYHSDTILEQSKLISDMRTDHEMLLAELRVKEEELLGLRLQYASEQARREIEEAELSRLRQRQIEDVKEWSVFSTLDRTFGECSSSTNMGARTALLRQLIENTAYDADDAQKELDEYNFHQTRINEVSEALSQKELRKNDLTMRLNEVNTGCQVVARQMERARMEQAKCNERYSELYDMLNTLISLNNWYNEWQKNHENLRMRIEKMMERWKQLNHDIQQKSHRQDILRTMLDEKRNVNAYLDSLSLRVREGDEKRSTLWKEGEKTYENLLGKAEVEDFFDTYYQRLKDAMQKEHDKREETQQSLIELTALKGRKNELAAQGQSLDAATADQRSRLDIWMRQFNASHPPVQYAELERVFANDRDWNALRETVRGIRIEAMLEQSRVDSLRSAIVALQAEGMRPTNTEGTDVLESLLAQEKQQEKQRQELLMQWAEYRLVLRSHEEQIEKIRAEEEDRYIRTNNPNP